MNAFLNVLIVTLCTVIGCEGTHHQAGPYKIVLDDDLTVLVLAEAFKHSEEHVNITYMQLLIVHCQAILRVSHY
jgi:hypothetical protein